MAKSIVRERAAKYDTKSDEWLDFDASINEIEKTL